MGPPRRNGARKPSVQYSSDSSAPAQSPVLPRQTAPTPSKPPATNNAMTASTRYLYNLKVLRRRDPSITSVFDQFSHVAVYQFVDGKWEREACEGTMFLYERNAYPPYGYYILNRVGMEDFIGRLYPEDFLQKTGKLTAVQSFPDFTERRLAAVHASAPQYELENRFSSVWAVPNVEALTKAEKGSVVTIGLWTLDEVAREPLFEVMQRLHSYIRRNLPYPEEFRYGPDRLPVPSSSPAPIIPNGQSFNGFTFPQTNGNGENHSNPGISELDKLFSKLAPSPPPAIPDSNKGKKNGQMTVQSLFASMSGTESTSDNNPPSASSSVSFPSSGSPAPSTGISLLDSIFASAATTTATTSAHTSARGLSQATNHVSTIYTPTPSSGVNPQVLSQDVITQLMGLPPSRAASTVSFSSSAVSHPSSREGYADNEDNSDSGTGRLSEFEDGISESSTVLDSGAEDVGAPAPGHGHLMPVNFGSGSTHQAHGIGAHGRVQGDMTPRPPLPGFGGSVEARPIPSRSSTLTSLPPSLKSTATITNGQRCTSEPHVQPKPKPQPQQGTSQQVAPRRLVPFEPDSELWPYSRNNAATHNHNASQQDSSDDIIELDFNDTSALSDPEAFNKAARNGRGAHHQHNGSASSGAGIGLNGNAKGKVKEKPNKRKTKKERAAEQARVRQEIEDSWDSPASVGHSGPGRSHHTHAIADNDKDVFPEVPPPATPSPCPSPILGPVVSPRAAITPLSLVGPRGGTDSRGSPVAQGNALHPSPMDLRRKIAAINGHVPVNEHAPKDHKEVVRDSLLAAVLTKEAQRPAHPVLEKNDFVREVLTLIHTDKAFVESLYREYTNRL